MTLIDYVSLFAQCITYVSFLSGAKVCSHIHTQRSCAKLSPAPFLMGLLCMAFWLHYGFLADEWEIITVNFVGLICQTLYISCFFTYSRQKRRLMKNFALLVLFLSLSFLGIRHSANPLLISGLAAAGSSTLACASPLATLSDVMRTKSVASMPFPIIVSGFTVCLSWFTFGVLKGDNFIMVSNFIGVCISGFQLTLFLIYPSKNAYDRLSQSNQKSYDLIRLLYADEDELEAESLDADADAESLPTSSPVPPPHQIDANQDYKETLIRLMGEIYSKGEQSTRSTSTVVLLCAAMLSG